MNDHLPTINRVPYFSSPWVYWVYCSCGLYRPTKHADDLHAWKAWHDHARAKEYTHDQQ